MINFSSKLSILSSGSKNQLNIWEQSFYHKLFFPWNEKLVKRKKKIIKKTLAIQIVFIGGAGPKKAVTASVDGNEGPGQRYISKVERGCHSVRCREQIRRSE